MPRGTVLLKIIIIIQKMSKSEKTIVRRNSHIFLTFLQFKECSAKITTNYEHSYAKTITTFSKETTSILAGVHAGPLSRLEMLVFVEGRKR